MILRVRRLATCPFGFALLRRSRWDASYRQLAWVRPRLLPPEPDLATIHWPVEDCPRRCRRLVVEGCPRRRRCRLLLVEDCPRRRRCRPLLVEGCPRRCRRRPLAVEDCP